MQADLVAEPRQAEDGRLWTPGAVDFFRTVNEQIAVVEEHIAGGLLLRTAQAAVATMKEFQARPGGKQGGDLRGVEWSAEPRDSADEF